MLISWVPLVRPVSIPPALPTATRFGPGRSKRVLGLRTVVVTTLALAIASSGCARTATVTPGPQAQDEILNPKLHRRTVRVQTADSTYVGRLVRADREGGVVLEVPESELWRVGSEAVIPIDAVEDVELVSGWRNGRLAAYTLLGVVGIFGLVRLIHPDPIFNPDTARPSR